MRPFLSTYVTCWAIAVTAHLPVPVFDGDDRGSRHCGCADYDMAVCTHAVTTFLDIDVVLLGCDEPDDPDDGPFDDDPERGEFLMGPFPVFIQLRQVEPGHCIDPPTLPCGQRMLAGVCIGSPLQAARMPFALANRAVSCAEFQPGRDLVIRC